MEQNAPQKKIVIIEDDSFILDIYAAKFKEHNFDVVVARDGAEGLEKIIAGQPDLIVLDLLMPKEDGFFLLEHIQDIRKNRPMKVLVVSNFSKEDVAEKISKFGIDGYITKLDATPLEIIQKVENLLS